MNRNRTLSINRVFLFTIIFSFFGSYINGWIFELTENYLLILLTSQTMLVIPSVIYLIKNKINLAEAIRFKKMKAGNIILTILLSYLISPLMTFINAISMLFVENTTSNFMINVTQDSKFLVSLFVIALIPSLLEESVYRGIFYNEYRKTNPLGAVFLSAFLFGIMHLNFNQFAYAFAMGIVFALVIEATDSILSTMIIHFFINGMSVVTLYLYPKLLEMLSKLTNSMFELEGINGEQLLEETLQDADQLISFQYIMEVLFWPAVICTLLAFLVYRTIAKNSGRWENVKGIFTHNKRRGSLKSTALIAGIAICIVLMIVQEIL